MREKLEQMILEKMEKGLLDGMVGNDFIPSGCKTIHRKIIKDGIPQILKMGPDSKYFDNKENIRVAGKVTKKLLNSVTEKLEFIQKYGWLMNDPDAKAYSALFKKRK